MMQIYTIGHSNRTADEFVGILQGFEVTRLIDVRRFPASKSQPQFNSERLSKALSKAGIGYRHMEQLGGRRPKSRDVALEINAGWRHPAFHHYADYALDPEFQEGLHQLLAMAQKESCAVMCAEVLWWRCHRRIIADYLLANGIEVVHIFTKTKSEPASMTPFAVVDAQGQIQYRQSHPLGKEAADHATSRLEAKPS